MCEIYTLGAYEGIIECKLQMQTCGQWMKHCDLFLFLNMSNGCVWCSNAFLCICVEMHRWKWMMQNIFVQFYYFLKFLNTLQSWNAINCGAPQALQFFFFCKKKIYIYIKCNHTLFILMNVIAQSFSIQWKKVANSSHSLTDI